MSSLKNNYWLPELLTEGFLANEYSSEWRDYLLKINLNEKKLYRDSNRFTFYTRNTIQCVFDICKMLHQPPEVRYLAVDILDRFLVKHFFSVVKDFKKMENCSLLNWQITNERMLDQSLLRILSSIQLAGKYCHSSNIISVTTVKEAIEAFEYSCKYSKRSIIKSESRVYQTLNYNIPSKTPLVYIEMFFGELQNCRFFQEKKIGPSEFFVLCVHVLDVATIYHQELYKKLMECLKENFNHDGIMMASLEADNDTLAAAVITTASVLLNPNKTWSYDLPQFLCFIGGCKEHIVQILTQQIINIVIIA